MIEANEMKEFKPCIFLARIEKRKVPLKPVYLAAR